MIRSTDTAARTTQGVIEAHVQDGAPIANPRVFRANTVAEHVCRIHARTHVVPGAILCGGVTVGEGTFIGAGSVVKGDETIGSRATIGLGAVVIRDVADGQTVVGAPARGIDAN